MFIISRSREKKTKRMGKFKLSVFPSRRKYTCTIKFDKAGYININLSEKFKFSLHEGKLLFILYVAWHYKMAINSMINSIIKGKWEISL